MALAKFDGLELPASADFHVHLRDGDMMETVVPSIRLGGVNTVYVMPNLVPPITTVKHALEYQEKLIDLNPRVNFLMSLYLHESITPETIIQAKQAGIIGVKSYPAGVTTNSFSGVVDYQIFYPVFAEMERQDMILNLHGESPSGGNITVLNAEEAFLPTLHTLHGRFPRLRIILEHCTTAAAIEAVKACGPNVAATITAHHMFLTVDDWASDPFCFCKPVAKLPSDREALLRTAASGNPKFFLGTDSAPHPVIAKRGGNNGKGKTAAGVFTQPYATQLVFDALEMGCEKGVLNANDISIHVLEGFLGKFGRRFYGVEDPTGEKIRVKNTGTVIMDILGSPNGRAEVVPFRRGHKTWALEWVV